MNNDLGHHVRAELAAAARAPETGAAWHHLERAHILSQPLIWLHTRVHIAMLVLAVRTADLREIGGQLIRLALAGIGSAMGSYPVGNTGRSNVPLTAPMPIPNDLARVLTRAECGGIDVYDAS
jgi:hypothetical protein